MKLFIYFLLLFLVMVCLAAEDTEDISKIGREVAKFERVMIRLLDKLKTIEVDIYDIHAVNGDLVTLNQNMGRLSDAISKALDSFNKHLGSIGNTLNTTISKIDTRVSEIKGMMGSRSLLCRSNEQKICFSTGKCACYVIGPIPLVWGKAKGYCAKINADLVTISTKEEDAFLLLMLRQVNETQAWMNGRQEDYNRPWRWMGKKIVIADGTTFPPGIYHNWMDGTPGVRKNVAFPRCLYLGWSTIFGLGGWAEDSCSQEIKPLCWRPLRSAKKL